MILADLTRFFSFILLSAMILAACQPKAKEEESMLAILCIGQSNMAGRAEIPAEDTITQEKVFLFNDQDQWEPAKNPLNRYSTIRKEMPMQRLSLGWTFSQSLSEKYPDKKFGLVFNVRGGTAIDAWGKGSYYYNEAMIKALKAQRDGAKFIGVIWHQGEGDRNKSEVYAAKFADMVQRIRADLDIPDLPVVIGEVGNWKGNSDDINGVLASIPEKVPHVACVSADELTHMGDTVHFSAEAQHELGRRYAEKFIELARIK